MYTQGEWLVMGNQRNGHFDFVLPMADDRDFQDNARLISAAPDLLEVLRALTAIVNGCRIRKKEKERHLNNARAAIAKAEGK
jgi:argininosuccinate lyase